MKKTKLFEVSLINKAYSRVVRDTTRFYTSDTALEIGFKLAEAEYSFDSGVILLLNEDDRSLVVRDLTREGAGFIYTLEDDIIEHYGNWAAQLKFEKDGETYVSSPVGFSIHNDLYNSRPPKLSEVNTWKNLRAIADGLIDDLREELEALEAQEAEIKTAEVVRQEAETQRVSAELQRENDHANRSAELAGKADKVVLKNLIVNGDFSDGLNGWEGTTLPKEITGDSMEVRGVDYQKYIHATQNNKNLQANAGEQMYLFAKVKVYTPPIDVRLEFRSLSVLRAEILNNVSVDTWYQMSGIVTSIGIFNIPYIRVLATYANNESALTARVALDDIMAINLTQTFGAGNEPTKEEMDELIQITGYFDGEYALNNKELLNWMLALIRRNRNAIVALGGA